ncbi:MAG: hypothetical protein M3Y82_01995, partial [Verrucomicrobiota bacterium]|nr:hypothetical protein [Verrucomicrobiota bacterium]
MSAYADSSFITSLYLEQENSARAISLVRRLEIVLPFTPLHRLEVRNAIRLAAFRKEITAEQTKAALQKLELHL